MRDFNHASNIGYFTGIVNGYLTGSKDTYVRLFYRMDLAAISARIDRRLKAVGISATAASKAAGLSEDAIRNMRRAVKADARQGVSTNTISALAPILGTSAAWLLEEQGQEEVKGGLSAPMITIPILADISAGQMMMPDNSYDVIGEVQAGGLMPGDWIALKVRGSSMDRISPPESIILVNRNDRQLVANACYIIEDEHGNATYKRYRPNPDRFEPVSTDKDLEPIFPDHMPPVVGRVRRTILDL